MASDDDGFGIQELDTNESKDFSKRSSSRNDADDSDVPISVQSIITQTDAYGNAISRGDSRHEAQFHSKRLQISDDNGNWTRLICSCFSRDKTLRTGPPVSTLSRTSSIPTSSPQLRVSFRNVLSGSNRPMPAVLPDIGKVSDENRGKKLLALDLDETLVHSSFQPVKNANYIIPVNIDGTTHKVFVIKRPGVDDFIKRLSEHYEMVVYTASLSKYADPLLDELDKDRLISKRFFRDNCVFFNGHYVKDLSLFKDRDLSQTIIIDNSPMSYIFQPENAIDCTSFIDSETDTEMWQIADFLIAISKCEDVRKYCRRWREWCNEHPSQIPTIQ